MLASKTKKNQIFLLLAVKDTDWPWKENLPLLGKSIMSPPHMSPAVNLYTCSPTDKVVHRRSPLDWMHQYDVISNGRNINRCNKIFTVYKEDNKKSFSHELLDFLCFQQSQTSHSRLNILYLNKVKFLSNRSFEIEIVWLMI